MLSIDELADYLGLPVRTLYDWRQSGRGPEAIHVGRQLRYFVSDVAQSALRHRRVTGEPARRYERSRPGELIRVDVTKFGSRPVAQLKRLCPVCNARNSALPRVA